LRRKEALTRSWENDRVDFIEGIVRGCGGGKIGSGGSERGRWRLAVANGRDVFFWICLALFSEEGHLPGEGRSRGDWPLWGFVFVGCFVGCGGGFFLGVFFWGGGGSWGGGGGFCGGPPQKKQGTVSDSARIKKCVVSALV